MADAPPPPRTGRLAAVALLLAVTVVAAGVLFWARPDPAPIDPGPQARTNADEQPLAYYLARADATRGETLFRSRCGACHTVAEGAPHALGPNLWGVMGGGIASRPGYIYSRALTDPPAPSRGRWMWDWETTSRFLSNPRAFAPGTRMTFAGMIVPQDRADVMLYLDLQGGTLMPPARAR